MAQKVLESPSTMTGEVDEKGLIYKVVEDLMRRSKNVAARISLSVSLLEVRQELVKDLLVSNSRRLEIKKGKVMGLSTLPIQSVDQMWKLLESSPRDSSSSSHRLVRVSVQGTRSKSVSSLSTNATNHLWFVDMAGSQVDGARGVGNSFAALEDMLSTCASRDRCNRNSQLTHLLGDCSKMGIVFNVSPTYLDFGDSICSFNFAKRITESMKKSKKEKKKSPLEKYRELRQEIKNFPYDKKYSPSEPQDPLGYFYNGLLTAATQVVFRSAEYLSRRNPGFVQGCNAVATTVQNRAAGFARQVIREESPYSSRRTYEGVGGMYAMSRFLIPALATLAYMGHSKFSEKEAKTKSESERDEYVGSAVMNLEEKINDSIGKIEISVAELKEAVRSIQADLKKKK